MELNIAEALRYLGIREDPEDRMRAALADLAQALQSRLTPRFIWTLHRVEDLALPGQMARTMLQDCRECALLVCTLGGEFDQWVRREQHRDMTRAVLLDALGSVYVESGCDAAEDAIRARFLHMYLTDRFSPGYGDLPLDLQAELLARAGGSRIGVTVTESQLMLPQKSVTAIVGLADRPQKARIRGCAHCSFAPHCDLRKGGTPCHV